MESVEKCSVQAAELHRLDWENRRRADEVRELQKASTCLDLKHSCHAHAQCIMQCLMCNIQALSDAHAFLFEERQRLLALQAENDELRLQEIEDRKRIQQACHAPYSLD